MNQSDCFQIGKEIPWEDAGPGVRRQVYGYGDQLMLVKARFEKGAEGVPHQHPHAQATYVAEGSFEMTIGNEKRIVTAGDGFYVAPQVWHGCVCLEAGMLVDAFSPCRVDFL
ncbi:cupin domain-containing protein [Niabella drilacis]|uniref:Cupin domain-containing protein n=1 Tax=Niabella drilacis (strain DSM 25811 / CCM 8410 / CCUG 62505 / LMG 26954 / E90) TaxID=1285928 RepID=A0A1G6NBA8_NIADE|nr:cupin domain-containing protein [Niabella drilacis]SDC64674.1 Cupin domain-containing protein [Niabella drilacis]